MKYLKGNIFTALHRERDACSTPQIFMESLEELKTVFYRNSQPMALVEARIKRFLADDKKREREPTNITIVLEYTSPNIEQYICWLTRKMSDILPNFRVNVCYSLQNNKAYKIVFLTCQAEIKPKRNVKSGLQIPLPVQIFLHW